MSVKPVVVVSVAAMAGSMLWAPAAGAAPQTQTQTQAQAQAQVSTVSGAAVPTAAGFATTARAAARVPGRMLVLRLSGAPRKASARVVVKGPKQYRRVVKVRSAKPKRLQRLRPGKYRVTPRSPGVFRQWSITPSSVRVKQRRGAMVTLPWLPKKARMVSTGGRMTVAVAGARVVAPAGAIDAGESLTVTRLPSAEVPRGGVPGSLVRVSTSQGQPDEPVRVVLTFDQAALPGDGDPVIVHRDELAKVWAPERTRTTGRGQVSATVDHFSLFSVVNRFTWGVGVVFGNRSAEVLHCVPSPSWVYNDFNWATGIDDPVRGCPERGSNASTLRLHLVNNRNRFQALRVRGLAFDVQASWFSTSVVTSMEKAMAGLWNATHPATVLLPPKGSATLVFRKPADVPTPVTVSIDEAGQRASQVTSMIWAFLTQVPMLGVAVEGDACIGQRLATAIDLPPGKAISEAMADAADGVRSCASVAVTAASWTKAAKTAFVKAAQKVAWGVFAVDIGQKLIDAWVDNRFPAHLEFTIRKTNARGRVLVADPENINASEAVGSADFLEQTLRDAGYTVDRVQPIPDSLSGYEQVWVLGALAGIDDATQRTFISFVNGGGGLYLTGERPCCEALNASVQAIANGVLASAPQIGGQGDANDAVTNPVNAAALQGLDDTPNVVTNWSSASPGLIGTVPSRNSFASNNGATTAAAWDQADMQSEHGRLAVFMDVNWLGDNYRGENAAAIVQNLARFLADAS